MGECHRCIAALTLAQTLSSPSTVAVALQFSLTMEVPVAGLNSAMRQLWLCFLMLTVLFGLAALRGRGRGAALGPPLGPMGRTESAVGSSRSSGEQWVQWV